MNRRIEFSVWPCFLCLTFICLMSLQACGDGGKEVEKCLESGDCISTIEVAALTGNLPLDPEDEFWTTGKGSHQSLIELGPQMITNPKWPNPSVQEVRVQAVRNKTEIAINIFPLDRYSF